MNTKEKILNLCDRWNFSLKEQGDEEIFKIAIGSYTCKNYFKYLADMIEQNNIHVPLYDLVIPTFSEYELECLETKSVKRLIAHANKIVVNDFGILKKMTNHRIRLGRLIFKDYRDQRYSEYDNGEYQFEPMNIILHLKQLGYRIEEMECDLITKKLLINVYDDVKVYVHYPYRQVSCSHICEFASIGKSISDKFRPNDKCARDCKNIIIRTKDPIYLKIGKGVYEEINDVEIDALPGNANLIITPRWLE